MMFVSALLSNKGLIEYFNLRETGKLDLCFLFLFCFNYWFFELPSAATSLTDFYAFFFAVAFEFLLFFFFFKRLSYRNHFIRDVVVLSSISKVRAFLITVVLAVSTLVISKILGVNDQIDFSLIFFLLFFFMYAYFFHNIARVCGRLSS